MCGGARCIGSAADVRGGGVHHHPPAHGAATEQHTKPHGIAVGQGQIDRPCLSAQAEPGADDRTMLPVAVGAGDMALANEFCQALNGRLTASLVWMDVEAYQRAAIIRELPDMNGVQGRCQRPGVDLDLDRRYGQLGEGGSLPPADSHVRRLRSHGTPMVPGGRPQSVSLRVFCPFRAITPGLQPASRREDAVSVQRQTLCGKLICFSGASLPVPRWFSRCFGSATATRFPSADGRYRRQLREPWRVGSAPVAVIGRPLHWRRLRHFSLTISREPHVRQ